MTPDLAYFIAQGRSLAGVEQFQRDVKAYTAFMRALAEEIGVDPVRSYITDGWRWVGYVLLRDAPVPAGLRREKWGGWVPQRRTPEGKAILAKRANAPKVAAFETYIGAANPTCERVILGSAGPRGGMHVASGHYGLEYIGDIVILTTAVTKDGAIIGTPPLDAEQIPASRYHLLREQAAEAVKAAAALTEAR